MYARLTTFQGTANKITEAIPVVENDVIPGIKVLAGFKHGYWFADRKSGRMLDLTLFETDAELQSTEAAASQIRRNFGDKLGYEVKNVERFELIAHA